MKYHLLIFLFSFLFNTLKVRIRVRASIHILQRQIIHVKIMGFRLGQAKEPIMRGKKQEYTKITSSPQNK